jgi:hypothetical protein
MYSASKIIWAWIGKLMKLSSEICDNEWLATTNSIGKYICSSLVFSKLKPYTSYLFASHLAAILDYKAKILITNRWVRKHEFESWYGKLQMHNGWTLFYGAMKTLLFLYKLRATSQVQVWVVPIFEEVHSVTLSLRPFFYLEIIK